MAPLLQNILESQERLVLQHLSRPVGDKKINRISVKTEANRIIAAFPKEGLEFYQQTYGQTGSGAARRGHQGELRSRHARGPVAAVLPHQGRGEATVLLGTLYLERGNYLEAAYAFERSWLAPGIDELAHARARSSRRALAFKRSGDPRHADLLKATLDGTAEGRRRRTG